MIPFFSPFTAPDGTARRPIVERVPECRPKFVRWVGNWIMNIPAECRHDPYSYPDDAPSELASDLCCMACLRWLGRMAAERNAGMARSVFEGGAVRWIHSGWSIERTASSDAEALNMIAHAVADELGIEP